MESFLNRYRNITVLLLVIFAQLVLLAAQVKNDQDVRVIRVWAVSTVTPVARIAEFFRGGSTGFLHRYILLHDAGEENRKLRDEVGRLRLENTFLRNEINTADRAKALQVFEAHTPSKMLAANVIMTGVGANANIVFVNRGSNDGVMRGMGVVTPDGIVGKVVAAYPGGSQVMLVSDPEFSAGVISQKSQSRGILKGQGRDPLCKVDYVRFEDKVEEGEWFYTSGDDRVFPRGFPVGIVKVVRSGTPFKEVLVEPAGTMHGVEDVLIIVDAVHQAIPDTPPTTQPVYIAPAPPTATSASPQTPDGAAPNAAATPAPPPGTEADKVRSLYKQAGETQNHVYGTGLPGSKPPDFTKLGGAPAATPNSPAKPPVPAVTPGTAPAGAAPPGDTRLQRQAPDAASRPPQKSPAADDEPRPTTKRATDNTTAPKSATPQKTPADQKGPAAPPKGPGGPGAR